MKKYEGKIGKYVENMKKHFHEFPEYVKGNPILGKGPMGSYLKITFLELRGAEIFPNRGRGTRSKEKILWAPIRRYLSVGLDPSRGSVTRPQTRSRTQFRRWLLVPNGSRQKVNVKQLNRACLFP